MYLIQSFQTGSQLSNSVDINHQLIKSVAAEQKLCVAIQGCIESFWQPQTFIA